MSDRAVVTVVPGVQWSGADAFGQGANGDPDRSVCVPPAKTSGIVSLRSPLSVVKPQAHRRLGPGEPRDQARVARCGSPPGAPRGPRGATSTSTDPSARTSARSEGQSKTVVSSLSMIAGPATVLPVRMSAI